MYFNKKIPFYKNPDNTHCYQAVIKMLTKYYWPNKNYSWTELDEFTAKQKDKWTYPTAGMLWLSELGVEVKSVENFDYDRFLKKEGDYLIELYGKEVGEECIKNTDVSEELKIVQEFKKKIKYEVRIPELDEIKSLIKDSWNVCVAVNSNKLNNKEGFVGHFLLIKGFDDNGFYLNDPGPDDAMENRFVDYELFESAWAYPDKNSQNIMAFKKI
ncbi:hypothetical protein C4544_06670 [candidate division WS5 bacterium]|uniref:Peptidase C39-like domain-containing protein n=1 Tax=candidate division WS5 bacterium TaxID=2093353 RepID=A0A419DAC0_9BACT|nr:MAG: hypothetical protein C4544_06670 [candidate division WS5 bacterium]